MYANHRPHFHSVIVYKLCLQRNIVDQMGVESGALRLHPKHHRSSGSWNTTQWEHDLLRHTLNAKEYHHAARSVLFSICNDKPFVRVSCCLGGHTSTNIAISRRISLYRPRTTSIFVGFLLPSPAGRRLDTYCSAVVALVRGSRPIIRGQTGGVHPKTETEIMVTVLNQENTCHGRG